MTTDLQRRGLLSSILGHLPSASYDDLRLLDLVIERLEFARTGHDRSWNFAVDLCDSLIRGLHGALHERDRQTAELQEAASAEMVGGPIEDSVTELAVQVANAGAKPQRVAIPANRVDLLLALGVEVELAITSADRRQRCVDEHGYGCARPECGRRIVRPEEITGLADWLPDAHLTTVSDVPARIAARDIDEDEPYAEWDVEDHGGESG